MHDEPPRSSSSVLYHLGVLMEAQRRQDQALEALPARVVEGITPRLTALEDHAKAHNKRLTNLEHEQWLTRGGGALAVLIIGWAVAATKPFGVHLG